MIETAPVTMIRKLTAAMAAASMACGAGVGGAATPGGQLTALPVQSARWTTADREALFAAIARSPGEGLRADDYDAAGLRTLEVRDGPERDAAFDRVALRLAHDHAEGSAPPAARAGWDIPRESIDYRAWLDAALARHDIAAALTALLPQDKRYAKLRDGFARCATPAHCLTIRVNLERWRWLPRTLGVHYLWVNPAAYRLDLIENDQIVSSHRIIVGKASTPTPAFAATVTGVTANPWWNVPQNIVAESVGTLVRTRPAEGARRGYVASKGADGRLRVRQKPGPQNALGLIKIEMPNRFSVFIHDTPGRELFAGDKRALSHGCIRTERPDTLARILLPSAALPEFERLLSSGTNGTVPLHAPVPVYIVYFTAEADGAAGGVRFSEDLYGRDRRLAAALSR